MCARLAFTPRSRHVRQWNPVLAAFFVYRDRRFDFYVLDHAHVDDDVARDGPAGDTVSACAYRRRETMFAAEPDDGAHVLGVERGDEDATGRLQLSVEGPCTLRVPGRISDA